MSNTELKERFVERARALSEEREIFRCTQMTSLICDSVGFGVPDDAKYFAAAYGDPAGREYWRTYLSEPMRIAEFSYLLSVHLCVKPEELEPARVAIILALQNAAAAGDRLFVGDAAPIFAFKGAKSDFGRLIDLKVRPRAAVLWLLSKPRREHFVPVTLRAFVEDRQTTKRRSVNSKNAQEFVVEYINKERVAGHRATLKGLEAAAKKAGFHGGREILREALKRSPEVDVKKGRPPKLAK